MTSPGERGDQAEDVAAVVAAAPVIRANLTALVVEGYDPAMLKELTVGLARAGELGILSDLDRLRAFVVDALPSLEWIARQRQVARLQ